MIYICSYCGERTRPEDDVCCNGSPQAISHGNCKACQSVLLNNLELSPEEVARRSRALVPPCQRGMR